MKANNEKKRRYNNYLKARAKAFENLGASITYSRAKTIEEFESDSIYLTAEDYERYGDLIATNPYACNDIIIAGSSAISVPTMINKDNVYIDQAEKLMLSLKTLESTPTGKRLVDEMIRNKAKIEFGELKEMINGETTKSSIVIAKEFYTESAPLEITAALLGHEAEHVWYNNLSKYEKGEYYGEYKPYGYSEGLAMEAMAHETQQQIWCELTGDDSKTIGTEKNPGLRQQVPQQTDILHEKMIPQYGMKVSREYNKVTSFIFSMPFNDKAELKDELRAYYPNLLSRAG